MAAQKYTTFFPNVNELPLNAKLQYRKNYYGFFKLKKYIKVLEERLLPQLNDWFPDKDYIFQQDGSPCHTGKMTKKWFHSNKIRVLK